jgi:hypothetical protein
MPAFISHCHEDKALYSTLCVALDGGQIPRFDVESLTPGLSLSHQLREIIKKCEVCIFLATRRSIKSQWCLAELGAFWGTGKRTIIYLADADLTESDIPVQFQGNLYTTNAQQLIGAVSDALKTNTRGPLPEDLLPVEYLQALEKDAGQQYDHIRLACAHTLWSFRPDRAITVLENQLGDWREEVKRHAKYLLSTYPERKE